MRGRDYRDYLQDILDSINDIASFIMGMGFEEFKRDKKTVNAVVRSIEVIGEASKKIPRTLKAKHKGIPWKAMAGIRDKLIHEYFGVDVDILWKTAKDDIPPLKQVIQNMMKSLEK
jgi:uncharacterized protein with HEPN domain